MKIALIVNPEAGGKKGGKLLPVIEKKLVAHNIEYHTYISLYHEHIIKLTSELEIKNYDARIDDGFMDILVAGKLSRTSLLATLPKIFKGTHTSNPAVKHFRAKTVKIKTWPDKTLLPDGELFCSTPTIINVHPKMIRYL